MPLLKFQPSYITVEYGLKVAGRMTVGRNCSTHDGRNTFRATDDGGYDNHAELYKIN